MREPEYIANFPGRVGYIVIRCSQCGIDYDRREVTEHGSHPSALHVARFTCPQGHRTENRRIWRRYDEFPEDYVLMRAAIFDAVRDFE
jgi:hypothetical protein